jgi:hypothetical protein
MGFDPERVLARDHHACRFRFHGCRRRATATMLDVPEFLGGPAASWNARAVCHHCAEIQHEQPRSRGQAVREVGQRCLRGLPSTVATRAASALRTRRQSAATSTTVAGRLRPGRSLPSAQAPVDGRCCVSGCYSATADSARSVGRSAPSWPPRWTTWCRHTSGESTRWRIPKVLARLAMTRRLHVRHGQLVDSVAGHQVSVASNSTDVVNVTVSQKYALSCGYTSLHAPGGNPLPGGDSPPEGAPQYPGYSSPDLGCTTPWGI